MAGLVVKDYVVGPKMITNIYSLFCVFYTKIARLMNQRNLEVKTSSYMTAQAKRLIGSYDTQSSITERL